ISHQGTATLQLNYIQEEGKLLVNTIDNVVLSDGTGVPVTTYSDTTVSTSSDVTASTSTETSSSDVSAISGE
ncbi:hypothetical protein SHY70_11855, partial [Streptococcus suis]|nr:hypothetical protein [Streptococcus suis]